MTRNQETSQHREGGQALIEFAIAGSLFFLLIFGMFDAGRAVWYHNTMQDTAQEASRYAAVHGANATVPIGPGTGTYTTTASSSCPSPPCDSKLTSIVDQYATGLSASQIQVTSTWNPASNAVGNTVTVTVTYPYTAISSYLGKVTFNITASSTRIIVH